MLEKVVFLDRDGVINADSPDYIKNWTEFRFLPNSLEALRKLHEKEFAVVVVTNQSMIGRQISSMDALREMHRNMKDTIETHGGYIHDIFFCPHRPEEACGCRKPKPGMIHKAREKYGIDLSSAYLIGDRVKDIQCARNAGVGSAVLVRTGNGTEAESILTDKDNPPDYTADDLLDAVAWILSRGGDI